MDLNGDWSQLERPVKPKFTEPEGNDPGTRAGERGTISHEKLDPGVRGPGRGRKNQDGGARVN